MIFELSKNPSVTEVTLTALLTPTESASLSPEMTSLFVRLFEVDSSFCEFNIAAFSSKILHPKRKKPGKMIKTIFFIE